MKRFYQLAAFVLLALPAAAFAQTCTQINSIPYPISTPGKYCLAKDFTVNMAGNYAIGIGASDVTIDCGGRTLRNINTSLSNSSVGIKAIGRNNIVVENCRVIGSWMNGIDIEQNNSQSNRNYYVNIRDNYVAGPLWHGIRAWGSAVEVSGNQVYDIGGRPNMYAIGIRVGGSTAVGNFRLHVVRDNYVVGTNSPASAAYGIFSDGSLSSAFLDNGIVGTSGKEGGVAYGLYVIGQHNRISDNHVTGVGAPGEWAIFGTDATTSCFDNYLRATEWTTGCDSTMGNY